MLMVTPFPAHWGRWNNSTGWLTTHSLKFSVLFLYTISTANSVGVRILPVCTRMWSRGWYLPAIYAERIASLHILKSVLFIEEIITFVTYNTTECRRS